MRSVRWLLLLAATAISPAVARAADIDASRSAEPPARATTTLPRYGVMADAGLPDGANASLVFRPACWLRLHGGGGYNMISTGVRAGATLVPFGLGPSATIEGGHYFDGDANGLAQRFAGQSFQSTLLEKVGYDYANFHLGLDFGYRRVTFYIHGGMSYVRAKVHNFDGVVASEAAANGASSANGANGGTTEISINQDPTVKAWFPSAKLGLIVYLW
jgi:hypothetical protein